VTTAAQRPPSGGDLWCLSSLGGVQGIPRYVTRASGSRQHIIICPGLYSELIHSLLDFEIETNLKRGTNSFKAVLHRSSISATVTNRSFPQRHTTPPQWLRYLVCKHLPQVALAPIDTSSSCRQTSRQKI
jgi:hypothetical protein